MEGPVEHFAMLNTKGCCVFNLQYFKRQLNHRKTNVLTEATVLGSIADAHQGPRKVGGLLISNEYDSWKWQLQTLCSKLRARADENNGYFLAIVLDQDGDNLNASHLAKRGGGSSKYALISEAIIVLSGPRGIERHDQQDILELISNYTHVPVLPCKLPGSTMHSYNALASLFTLEDHALLGGYLREKIKEVGRQNDQTTCEKRVPREARGGLST